MATQPDKKFFLLFGFLIWGDFGPLTMYKSKRGKLVAFAKTYPAKPASWQQERQRQRLSWAAKQWLALTAAQRADYEEVTKRLSLPLTGYNLFIHSRLRPLDNFIPTLERQSGITLA